MEYTRNSPWFEREATRVASEPSDFTNIPRSLEEISSEWLSNCLSVRYPGAEVVSSSVENASKKIGSSSIARVTATYNDRGEQYGLPETFIIKGAFGRHGQEFIEMDGVHLNEMRFYRDILPLIKTSTAQCFYAGYDPSNNQSIIFIEDLNKSGVQFCDALKPLTYDQSASVLNELARLHAQTWDHPEFKEGGKWSWVQPMFGMTRDGDFMYYYYDYYLGKDYWDNDLLNQERMAAISKVFHDRERLQRGFLRMAELEKESPKVLVHGDSHMGNLYMAPGDVPGLIDWQVKQGVNFVDVAYDLISTLDIADRRKWEKSLLTHYLGQLRDHGGPKISFDDAWLRYRRGIVWGLFIWITNDNLYQDPRINTAQAARFAAAALDHDTYGVLQV